MHPLANSWVVSSHEVTMTMVAKKRKNFYHDQHLTDAFIPFVIEVFNYMHQQADDFLH
jgi:hypothetical protein